MGEKYTPKVGDRVLVVLEGEVGHSGSATGAFLVGAIVGGNYITPSAEHVVSIERVEEVFGPGDTVRSRAGGFLYTLAENGYYDHTARRVFTEADGADPGAFTSEYYERVS